MNKSLKINKYMFLKKKTQNNNNKALDSIYSPT